MEFHPDWESRRDAWLEQEERLRQNRGIQFTPEFLAKLEAEQEDRELEEAKAAAEDELADDILSALAAGDGGAADIFPADYGFNEAFRDLLADEDEEPPAPPVVPPPPLDFKMKVSRGPDGRIMAPVAVKGSDGSEFSMSFTRDARTGRITGDVVVRPVEAK
jgi:hypothetical protein